MNNRTKFRSVMKTFFQDTYINKTLKNNNNNNKNQLD